MASLARILGLTFLFLVGCRAPCYLDPVENFTYDARSDYLLLDPEFGPMTFGFLYQDRLMRGIWTEEELALGALEGIRWYDSLPGRTFSSARCAQRTRRFGANPKHFSYLVLEDRKPESLFISVLDIEENIKTKINVCWAVYHLGQIEKILSL